MNDEKHDEAFAALVHDHHAGLRAFIRALGVAREWVDDLAQDAFLIAYRELDQFDDERDFGKWLRGIARNLVRNEIRKDARRKRIMNEGLTELLLRGQAQSAEESVFEEVEFAALRNCVEQLPDKSRELVAGRYRDGWNSTDLADQHGMTPESVRQALVRIRRRLKACIEKRMTRISGPGETALESL